MLVTLECSKEEGCLWKSCVCMKIRDIQRYRCKGCRKGRNDIINHVAGEGVVTIGKVGRKEFVFDCL